MSSQDYQVPLGIWRSKAKMGHLILREKVRFNRRGIGEKRIEKLGDSHDGNYPSLKESVVFHVKGIFSEVDLS